MEHKACIVTQESDLSLRAQGVRGQVLGANLLVVSSTVLLRAGIPTESLSKRGYLPFWDTCRQISLYIPIRRTKPWKNMKHPRPEGGRGLSQGFHLSQRDAQIYTPPFLFPGIPSS